MNIKPMAEEPPPDHALPDAQALSAPQGVSGMVGVGNPFGGADTVAEAAAQADARIRAMPLSARLREATSDVHRSAEETPFMRALTGGQVGRVAYCLLLRNLYALYATLERALDRHADLPQLAPLKLPELFRAEALQDDLAFLRGADWPFLPLTASMRSYVARLESLDRDRPVLLAAHAYVRYLGDLSGGQMLDRVVRGALGLAGDEGARFYAFGGIDRVAAAKSALRDGLDELPLAGGEADAVVDEAGRAFERHLVLFEELEATLARK
jgi:heme oxygenase